MTWKIRVTMVSGKVYRLWERDEGVLNVSFSDCSDERQRHKRQAINSRTEKFACERISKFFLFSLRHWNQERSSVAFREIIASEANWINLYEPEPHNCGLYLRHEPPTLSSEQHILVWICTGNWCESILVVKAWWFGDRGGGSSDRGNNMRVGSALQNPLYNQLLMCHAHQWEKKKDFKYYGQKLFCTEYGNRPWKLETKSFHRLMWNSLYLTWGFGKFLYCCVTEFILRIPGADFHPWVHGWPIFGMRLWTILSSSFSLPDVWKKPLKSILQMCVSSGNRHKRKNRRKLILTLVFLSQNHLMTKPAF